MRITVRALSFLLIFTTCIAQNAKNISNYIHDPSISVTSLPNGLVKITDKRTGIRRVKDISDYGAYSSSHDSLVIDMRTIDTSLYSTKYVFWCEVPVSNADMMPLAVGDQNHNGRMEVVGLNEEWTDLPGSLARSQVYELSADRGYELSHTYPDLARRGIAVMDGSADTSAQVFLLYRGQLENYAFSRATSLCTNLNYVFNPGPAQLNTPVFGDFDRDGKLDVVYFYMGPMAGDTAFSLPGHDTLGYAQSYHSAEYDSSIGNFTVRSHWRGAPNDRTSGWGFATGDFDMDGKTEIATATVHGVVHVVECDSNDSYHETWQGKVETYNAWLDLATNDIDHNGKPEFWIGGDAYYNGVGMTRITCFESTGDNQYLDVFHIDIIGIISFFAGNMVAADVDKDGTDELIVCIDQNVLVFKSVGIRKYKLFYLKRNELANQNSVYYGATTADLDGDGVPEILISGDQVNPNGVGLHYRTWIYQHNFSTSVTKPGEQPPRTFLLSQNYPNPFNPSTTIEYELAANCFVTLKIYDMLGREIKTLTNGRQNVGTHSISFNAGNLPSGVYFYRLAAGNFTDTKKMLLLR